MNVKTKIPVIVAAITLMGLAVHDTKLDVASTVAIAIPVAVASTEGLHLLLHVSDTHTHEQQVNYAEITNHFNSYNPWIHTRHGENKHYRLAKSVVKGRHPFDNYTLPILA